MGLPTRAIGAGCLAVSLTLAACHGKGSAAKPSLAEARGLPFPVQRSFVVLGRELRALNCVMTLHWETENGNPCFQAVHGIEARVMTALTPEMTSLPESDYPHLYSFSKLAQDMLEGIHEIDLRFADPPTGHKNPCSGRLMKTVGNAVRLADAIDEVFDLDDPEWHAGSVGADAPAGEAPVHHENPLGLILLGAGFLFALLAHIWFVVMAFRRSIAWGFACIFLWPVQLAFLILHWDVAKQPFKLYGAAMAIIVLGGWAASRQSRSVEIAGEAEETQVSHPIRLPHDTLPAPTSASDPAAVVAALAHRGEAPVEPPPPPPKPKGRTPASMIAPMKDVLKEFEDAGHNPSRLTDAVWKSHATIENVTAALNDYRNENKALDAQRFADGIAKARDQVVRATREMSTAGQQAMMSGEASFAKADSEMTTARNALSNAESIAPAEQ